METKKHLDKLVEIASLHGKAMAKQALLEVVIPALKEYAASTPNKMDDLAVAVGADAVQKAVESI